MNKLTMNDLVNIEESLQFRLYDLNQVGAEAAKQRKSMRLTIKKIRKEMLTPARKQA